MLPAWRKRPTRRRCRLGGRESPAEGSEAGSAGSLRGDAGGGGLRRDAGASDAPEDNTHRRERSADSTVAEGREAS